MTQNCKKNNDAAQPFADFPEPAKAPDQYQTMTFKDKPASPHAFVRAALFGVSEPKGRKLLMPDEEVVLVDEPGGLKVAVCGGLRSKVKGPMGSEGEYVSSRFDQDDYSIYLGLLLLGDGQLGVDVTFSPYAFLRDVLGKGESSQNARLLMQAVARMAETRIAVRMPKAGAPGHFIYSVGRLISGVRYDTQTKRYTIVLDTHMSQLFEPGMCSQLQWEQRMTLKTPLERWLHAELNSHTPALGKPYFRWTHKLHEAFGAECDHKKFKFRLKAAAKKVASVTGWKIQFVPVAGESYERLDFYKKLRTLDEPAAKKPAAPKSKPKAADLDDDRLDEQDDLFPNAKRAARASVH